MNFENLITAVESSLPAERIQESKHAWVSEFQKNLQENLNSVENGYDWEIEYDSSEHPEHDRIDVCGVPKGSPKRTPKWIIEIDATRADQIAKKFVSRLALYGLGESINYVAIMYPDTANGKAECEKYLRYCRDIMKKINPKSAVYGIFIYPDKGVAEPWHPDEA